MSPLIKKEIRLLLPAWTAAMLLAIVPTWIASVWSRVPSGVNGYVELAFALGILFLSLASFGEEFSLGAFSILLSQPMERRRIWLIKTTVLGAAFITVLLGATVSWNLDLFIRTARIPDFLTEFEFSALFVAVIFSSGLWATLLLRRMMEAFWLTLLAPLAIMVAFYGLHAHFHWSDHTGNRILPAVLLLYSVAGFFWARRLFLRAQDVPWTGGEIILPSRKGISRRPMVFVRRRHWLSALIWKEVQLHQVNILIAGIVLMLDAASVIIRNVHPHFTDPEVRGFLELVWVLWLLMPLLIGSVAVAEEHRGGTFASQLCLPVSRRVQFAIKFCVAIILSLILGGLMPLVIERSLDITHWIFAVAAAIFFVSFYASTATRTTLQAIGVAIAVAVVIYLYTVATAVSVFRLGGAWVQERVGIELLKLYVGLPILVFTLAGLMYWNFKWLHADGKLRWRNGVTLLASLLLIFASTNGVYFRAWEFLMAIEPPHAPARLSDLNVRDILLAGDEISVLLPDGRLWTEQLSGYDRGRIAPCLSTQRFIGGSNWVQAASDPYRIVGIQSDGSLWSVETYPEQSAYPLIRIGSDTNWAKVSGEYGFLLLKNDGSLWFWGATNYLSPKNLKTFLTIPPLRVGDGTNWTDVFGRWARKSDGSRWVFGFEKTATNANAIPQMTQEPVGIDHVDFYSQNSVGPLAAEISTNQELWLTVPIPFQNVQMYRVRQKIQLGKTSEWKAAAWAADSSLIAIRSDGTLWEWKWKSTRFWSADTYFSTQPAQLGTYSGWITLRSTGNWPPSAIALAADGGLWVWKDPSAHLWLAPSRKPVYLGNIFTAR